MDELTFDRVSGVGHRHRLARFAAWTVVGLLIVAFAVTFVFVSEPGAAWIVVGLLILAFVLTFAFVADLGP